MIKRALSILFLIGMGALGYMAFPFLLSINVILAWSVIAALALQILSCAFLLLL